MNERWSSLAEAVEGVQQQHGELGILDVALQAIGTPPGSPTTSDHLDTHGPLRVAFEALTLVGRVCARIRRQEEEDQVSRQARDVVRRYWKDAVHWLQLLNDNGQIYSSRSWPLVMHHLTRLGGTTDADFPLSAFPVAINLAEHFFLLKIPRHPMNYTLSLSVLLLSHSYLHGPSTAPRLAAALSRSPGSYRAVFEVVTSRIKDQAHSGRSAANVTNAVKYTFLNFVTASRLIDNWGDDNPQAVREGEIPIRACLRTLATLLDGRSAFPEEVWLDTGSCLIAAFEWAQSEAWENEPLRPFITLLRAGALQLLLRTLKGLPSTSATYLGTVK